MRSVNTTSPRVSAVSADPFVRTLAKDIRDLWRLTKNSYNATANATTNLFTVTGVVRAEFFPVVTGADTSGTVALGFTGDTDGIIAVTNGSNLNANVIWRAATGNTAVEADSGIVRRVMNATTITVTTASGWTGAIDFFVRWQPISSNGDIKLA